MRARSNARGPPHPTPNPLRGRTHSPTALTRVQVMAGGYLQQRSELVALACSVGAQLGLPGVFRMCACVRKCMHVCVRACVRACVRLHPRCR